MIDLLNIEEISNSKRNDIMEKDLPIHGWYRFVLGYPPHLVRYYINKFGIENKDIILDPFCGTGTTNVEALKNGIHSIGIEANYMTYLSSSVKTYGYYEVSALEDYLAYIINSAILSFTSFNMNENFVQYRKDSSFKPVIINSIPELGEESKKVIPKGFICDKPLKKVLIFREIIKSINVEHIKKFFMLSLAKVIVAKAGNVAFGPEVYKTKKEKEDFCAIESFYLNSLSMINDIQHFSAKAEIIHGDSRKINQYLFNKSKVNYVITSPPYPNEKDYTRSTRLETVLLGLMNDRKDLRNLKESLLRSNTRNIFKNDNDGKHVEKFQRIMDLSREIEAKRIELNKTSGFEKLYHKVVTHYFGGMYLHFRNLIHQ